MRQKGQSAAGINISIRSMNSFLSWLKEEEHVKEHLALEQLKAPVKPIVVFSDRDLALIGGFRPRTFIEFRTHTLIP